MQYPICTEVRAYEKTLRIAQEIREMCLSFLRIKYKPLKNKFGDIPLKFGIVEYIKLKKKVMTFYWEMLSLSDTGKVEEILSYYRKFANSEDGKLLDWILVRNGMKGMKERYIKLEEIASGFLGWKGG